MSIYGYCGGRNSAATESKTGDSVALSPAGNSNNYTYDRPEGDTNAMRKDSLYNADSEKRRRKVEKK